MASTNQLILRVVKLIYTTLLADRHLEHARSQASCRGTHCLGGSACEPEGGVSPCRVGYRDYCARSSLAMSQVAAAIAACHVRLA